MRILIVEDDAAMARGLAERLKLSGFAVDMLRLKYPVDVIWRSGPPRLTRSMQAFEPP